MKILFVCDGNICRSPLAAEYMRHRSVREGLSHLIVDSAGLLGITGAPAATFSLEVAHEAGLDLGRHRSRGITGSDLRSSDVVVAMTLTQLEQMSVRFPYGTKTRYLLRAFEDGPLPKGGAPELDDPVAGPIEEYRSAFAVIRSCVDHLVLHLKHAP